MNSVNSEEKYTLIEKYLDQQLSDSERREFEGQLAKDRALQREVELHRAVSKTLKGEPVHALRSVLNEVDQQWKAPTSPRIRKARVFSLGRTLAIAASIAMLVIAFTFFLNSGPAATPDQLFAEHYQTYPMLLSQRSADNALQSTLLEKAISAYAQKQYEASAVAFQKLAAEEPLNISYRFYEAVSTLETARSEQAIELFGQLIEGRTHAFTEQSRWYLGLAYLQAGQVEQAEKQFQMILPGQAKYGEGQEILEGLGYSSSD